MLSYRRPICLPEDMKHEEDRAVEIEFGILAVFVAGAFIAGLIAAVRHWLG